MLLPKLKYFFSHLAMARGRLGLRRGSRVRLRGHSGGSDVAQVPRSPSPGPGEGRPDGYILCVRPHRCRYVEHVRSNDCVITHRYLEIGHCRNRYIMNWQMIQIRVFFSGELAAKYLPTHHYKDVYISQKSANEYLSFVHFIAWKFYIERKYIFS